MIKLFNFYFFISSFQFIYFKGAVYIFKNNRNIWSEVAILQSPIGSYRENFGASILIANNQIVVGAPNSCNYFIFISLFLFK